MTEQELFQELKTAIDAVSSKEQQLREPLDKEYYDYCIPFAAEFDEATKKQKAKCEAVLVPAREELQQFARDQYTEFRKSILPLIQVYTNKVQTYFPNGEPDLENITEIERQYLIELAEDKKELDIQCGAEQRRCERPYEQKLKEYNKLEKITLNKFAKETKKESKIFDKQTETKRNQIDRKLAEIAHDADQEIALLQDAYNKKCKEIEV